MARHRDVRSMNIDEEYDGYYDSCYGHSVEEDFCISPQTEAQFLYNRDAQERHSMSAFFDPSSPNASQEEIGVEDSPHRFRSDSFNGEQQHLSQVDKAKLQSCIEAMQSVVGETVSEGVLTRAALAHDFDVEKALNAVLSGQEEPKPQRVKKDARIGNKEFCIKKKYNDLIHNYIKWLEGKDFNDSLVWGYLLKEILKSDIHSSNHLVIKNILNTYSSFTSSLVGNLKTGTQSFGLEEVHLLNVCSGNLRKIINCCVYSSFKNHCHPHIAVNLFHQMLRELRLYISNMCSKVQSEQRGHNSYWTSVNSLAFNCAELLSMSNTTFLYSVLRICRSSLSNVPSLTNPEQIHSRGIAQLIYVHFLLIVLRSLIVCFFNTNKVERTKKLLNGKVSPVVFEESCTTHLWIKVNYIISCFQMMLLLYDSAASCFGSIDILIRESEQKPSIFCDVKWLIAHPKSARCFVRFQHNLKRTKRWKYLLCIYEPFYCNVGFTGETSLSIWYNTHYFKVPLQQMCKYYFEIQFARLAKAFCDECALLYTYLKTLIYRHHILRYTLSDMEQRELCELEEKIIHHLLFHLVSLCRNKTQGNGLTSLKKSGYLRNRKSKFSKFVTHKPYIKRPSNMLQTNFPKSLHKQNGRLLDLKFKGNETLHKLEFQLQEQNSNVFNSRKQDCPNFFTGLKIDSFDVHMFVKLPISPKKHLNDFKGTKSLNCRQPNLMHHKDFEVLNQFPQCFNVQLLRKDTGSKETKSGSLQTVPCKRQCTTALWEKNTSNDGPHTHLGSDHQENNIAINCKADNSVENVAEGVKTLSDSPSMDLNISNFHSYIDEDVSGKMHPQENESSECILSEPKYFSDHLDTTANKEDVVRSLSESTCDSILPNDHQSSQEPESEIVENPDLDSYAKCAFEVDNISLADFYVNLRSNEDKLLMDGCETGNTMENSPSEFLCSAEPSKTPIWASTDLNLVNTDFNFLNSKCEDFELSSTCLKVNAPSTGEIENSDGMSEMKVTDDSHLEQDCQNYLSVATNLVDSYQDLMSMALSELHLNSDCCNNEDLKSTSKCQSSEVSLSDLYFKAENENVHESLNCTDLSSPNEKAETFDAWLSEFSQLEETPSATMHENMASQHAVMESLFSPLQHLNFEFKKPPLLKNCVLDFKKNLLLGENVPLIESKDSKENGFLQAEIIDLSTALKTKCPDFEFRSDQSKKKVCDKLNVKTIKPKIMINCKESLFSKVLCSKVKDNDKVSLPLPPRTAAEIAASMQYTRYFKFNTPSPDDIIKKQKKAFNRAGSKSKSHMTPNLEAIEDEPEVTGRLMVSNGEVKQVLNVIKIDTSETGGGKPLPQVKEELVCDTVNAESLGEKSSLTASIIESEKAAKNEDDVNPSESTPRTKSRANAKNMVEAYNKERAMEKPLINLVVVGHVDAGKSTLMGHLLFSLGCVGKKTMHKYEQDSKKLGKASFMYAWVLDETSEERNRGITMDVAQSKFLTPHRNVTLLDAPGHKDFIPNMITGAAQADVAVLVVDATRGEFETGFETGGQTREHTMLIRSLGVSQLAVAVNKLDNVKWDQGRHNEIVVKLSAFLKQTGFKEGDVQFVPCSGLTGENLIEPPKVPELKSWYSGPCLVDVIDNFKPPERPVNKPFHMCISDVFKSGSGSCVSGRIESGYIQNGDKVLVMPAAEQATVKGITVDEESVPHCFAGDHVTMQLTGMDVNSISSGSVVCDIAKPVKVSARFQARLVIFNTEIPITKGFPVIIHSQSMSEQAVIKKLVSQLHRSSGEVIKKKPRCLPKNTNAVVEVEVVRPICIELYKDFKDLGRFMLRSGGSTIAAGLVTEIF